MNRLECGGDWLVDYADCTANAVDTTAAREHLRDCGLCRRELVQLQQSQRLLHRRFNALKSEALSTSRHRSRRSAPSAGLFAASAAAAVALVAGWAWMGSARIPKAMPLEVAVGEQAPGEEDAVFDASGENEDVLAAIEREGRIARLQATVNILAAQPGMEERRAALQSYLTGSYQVTN